jgi:hypothetical protein
MAVEHATQERSVSSDGPQPVRGDRGASILGPRNVPLECENPDLLASPYTDAGYDPKLEVLVRERRFEGVAPAELA